MPLNESSEKSTTTASKLAGAGETLALLDRLRRTVRETVTRLEQAERDYQARAGKVHAQFEQAIETERSRWASEMEAERAAAEARRNEIEVAHAARKSRIARALSNARQRKAGEIDAEESRHTFAIQRDLLEADRVREVEAKANKDHYEAVQARLADELATIEQFEARYRSSLGAYRSLARLLPVESPAPELQQAPDAFPPEPKLLEELQAKVDGAAHELAHIRGAVLPLGFKFLPVWLWIILLLAAPFIFVPALRKFDFHAAPVPLALGLVVAGLALILGLWWLGKRLAAAPARAAVKALQEARRLHQVGGEKAAASFAAEDERIKVTHASATTFNNNLWKQKQVEAKALHEDWAERFENRARTLRSAADGRRLHRLTMVDQAHAERVNALAEQSSARKAQVEAAQVEGLAKLAVVRDEARASAEANWQNLVLPAYRALQAAAAAADQAFPAWEPALWQRFSLPEQFPHAARFAELAVDLERLAGVTLVDDRLGLPGPKRFSQPLLLDVPRQASLLFETKQSGQAQVVGALNNLVLRLFTSAPPGRLAFTIFDPVGLGQNFAGIMHLADFEERLINSRIWTQQAQFEQRLADLNEHIEKVTQMYLRNEYATLAEYNAQAGRMAEKYHFLVIADFPVNFSDVAVKRLMNIAAAGPRCGVHLLIHWDQRRPAPVEFVPDELRKNAICLVPKGEGFAVANCPALEAKDGAAISGVNTWEGVKLTLDAPPDAELATRLWHQIGKDSIDSSRVEMPFAEVAPGPDEFWSLDTTGELRVPIGRTGATKLQYLALGKGTRQHALVAGKTGSGKSTLFHVIITNLALWCSPEQVEFYLVDFKKGVEFKCYATQKLPHARVIAIESDREFGLSVLQRLDEELKRRGDLFRKLGAQDIAGYKRAGGTEPMPRVLLLIDEFQELFVEDDRVSQGASLLLDRIVRQGRAFGIHVILGSQTLGGAYTLARATIGQMVVRIALQCNEADAYLIMNEDNPAPRLLSRPGEAIYNDDAGAIQGNSPFQVVWLPDQERDQWLERAHRISAGTTARVPIVFEGNAPADVRENPLLRAALAQPAKAAATAPHVWLGAPNSIKGPTEAVFRRASGNHLLVVGQRDEAALAMLGIALVSLAAQQPKTAARFFVFDCSAPDAAEARFLERVIAAVPHAVRLVRPGDVDEVMAALAGEQQRRADGGGADAPETYLLVHGLQRNKKLRFDEEMSFSMDADAGANPGLQFNKLICEGAGLGFHVIATCDTYNNLMRMLSRKAVSEFEMRVVFQMSANDSASLIESPQANNLGLHRALFYNGHEGWLETFRPYALPDDVWVQGVREQLAAT
ncbi:MAG TPA: FtsK/SpoIIIE domain-containing protein [Verrucomicrobiae bacterium]|nr:FtsK/SpoIIIE domain-containing protein [Verrucomicrobiae bacterium]